MQRFANAYEGKRVLLTGHTGFKGSWLCAWLSGLGAEVCGFSDCVPTSPSLFETAAMKAMVRDERGRVEDRKRLAAVVAEFKPDFVFHLAAQAIVSTSFSDPLETFQTNVMGTAALLDVLRTCDHPCSVVVITSDKAYANVEWPWGYRENDRLGGHDIYSGSKGAAELAFHSFFHSFFASKSHPVRLASARAGNVIGGGDWAKDRIVADCIRAWKDGRKVEIRSPRATRPWQHVLEPLSGYLALGQALSEGTVPSGESYNFGPAAEQNATVLELLSSLAEIWGFNTASDSYTVTGDIPFREASLLKLCTDKALLELKWQPTLSYDACATMTGQWYKQVVGSNSDARAVTLAQIRTYEEAALRQGRAWIVP